MIGIYCRDKHDTQESLCPSCSELLDYACGRLDRCPFGTNKGTCANCAIHCYKPAMREKAKQVMRYAGSRMLWKHPLLAISHLFKGRRKNAAMEEKTP